MKTIQCTICGAERRVTPSSTMKYCSRACHSEARREADRLRRIQIGLDAARLQQEDERARTPEKLCPSCRAVVPASRVYCNDRCYNAHRTLRQTAARQAKRNAAFIGADPAAKRRGGRPPSPLRVERTCQHCEEKYTSKNLQFCSRACQLANMKQHWPVLAAAIKPLLGALTYDQICVEVTKATGIACHHAQVGRVVAQMRAAETNAAKEARTAAAMPAEGGLPRAVHITVGGAAITLRATSLPEVTADEVRHGAAALHGFALGLRLPEEKTRPKKKALKPLVLASGPEV